MTGAYASPSAAEESRSPNKQEIEMILHIYEEAFSSLFVYLVNADASAAEGDA